MRPVVFASLLMECNATTSCIYLVTAATGSLFVLNATGGWLETSIIWLCISVPPLLFVFAYSRFLLAAPVSRRRLTCEFLFHCLGVVSATIAFTFFSPYWKNPIRDPGESIVILLVPLAVLIVFLVAAVSLLLRSKSGFAIPASILIWPYWLVLALALEGHWYQDSGIYAVTHFLCFIIPVFFAFAAAVLYFGPRPGTQPRCSASLPSLRSIGPCGIPGWVTSGSCSTNRMTDSPATLRMRCLGFASLRFSYSQWPRPFCGYFRVAGISEELLFQIELGPPFWQA